MFDFDAGKLLIIGIVALVFIPSKDLPRVLRQIGQFVGKMRRMATEFQGQFMDAMREADMAELRREAEKLSKAAEVHVGLDRVHELNTEINVALEGKAALSSTEAAVLGAESEVATAHQAEADVIAHSNTIAPPGLAPPDLEPPSLEPPRLEPPSLEPPRSENGPARREPFANHATEAATPEPLEKPRHAGSGTPREPEPSSALTSATHDQGARAL
jgi:sec-independent protein translocase protein TatB